MVTELRDMADEVVGISDDAYCSGNDSVPDLKKVLGHISNSTDKNLLITSVGEYLRFAQKYEATVKCLHSIMTFKAHSKKRVWIPIYAAKDIFQDVVGELPAERYELYELTEEADEFECFVYSAAFATNREMVSVCGLKQMYRAWDTLDVCSGMAFSTKKITMISPSTGNYAIHVIKNPFEFIQQHLTTSNPKLEERLGTDAFWTELAAYAVSANGTLEDILEKALNVARFDAQQIVSGWGHLCSHDGFGKWLLWLWYQLGLTASGDYLGYAIRRAATVNDIQQEIECAIFSCVQNPAFDAWIGERITALKNMGITKLTPAFWHAFEAVSDERTKLKLLSNHTREERTKLIEIISKVLQNNGKISDYESILAERHPDLLLYFKESKYLTGSLEEYIQMYKQFKIMDYYDLSISEAATDVNTLEYDTRSKILNSIKCAKDAYYLWIDGMGVEWIDMLIDKVVMQKSDLADPTVEIGTAVVPTTTKVNIAKADPATVSQKYNKLDSLSHIKDKSDCNYYSIIDKQFELIGIIADMIVKLADEHAGMPIVVTADHGMSKMAAKAFHAKQALTPPVGAEVEYHGRYCVLQDAASSSVYSHTYKEDHYLAFREHSHFTCSGYAPGEIHGGASPEEWLVPVIVFGNNKQKAAVPDTSASYQLDSMLYQPDSNGNVEIKVRTFGKVKSLTLTLGTQTFTGINTMQDQWSVTIPQLASGNKYDIRIQLNNIFSHKVDTITVKRKGLDIDDDF